MKEKIYVLKKEVVGTGTGYGLFKVFVAPTNNSLSVLIEPQGEISDLVKLIRHDYKDSNQCGRDSYNLRFCFDRPSQVSELEVDFDGEGCARRCIKYTSLSPEERRKFVVHLSGYKDYGTERWTEFMGDKA